MLAGIDERIERALREHVERLGEPPGLRVGDPVAQDLQGCRRSFEEPELHPRLLWSRATSRPCPASVASSIASRKSCETSGVTEIGREPSPGSRGRARDGEARARRRGQAPDRRVGSHPRTSPGGHRRRATSVSAPTSSGKVRAAQAARAPPTGSVQLPRVPELERTRARACPSHGRRRGSRPPLGRRRPPPPGPRPPRGSGRHGRQPPRSGRAPRGVRGVLGGARASARSRFEMRRGGVQAERSFPGQGQEPQRRCLELGGLVGLSGGLRELQGGRVVVGEDVGEVLDPFGGLGLDPSRRGDVTRGPRGSGELPVGDVAGQHVPEGVLGLALDRGTTGGTHELLAGELPERLGDLGEVALAHLRDRTGPEDLPDHRGVGEHRLRVCRQRVQACGDQGLDRVGERDLGPFPQLPARALLDQQVLVLQQAHELLGVERVPTGALQDRLLELGGDHGRLQQRGDQTCGLLLGEWREVDRVHVARPLV